MVISIKRKSVTSDFDMVDETLEKRPKVCFDLLSGNISLVSCSFCSTSASSGLTIGEARTGPPLRRAGFK